MVTLADSTVHLQRLRRGLRRRRDRRLRRGHRALPRGGSGGGKLALGVARRERLLKRGEPQQQHRRAALISEREVERVVTVGPAHVQRAEHAEPVPHLVGELAGRLAS